MVYPNDDPETSAAIRTRATDTTGDVEATTADAARVRCSVLLVDSDSEFLLLLRAALPPESYHFLTAPSARIALEILRKEVVDVVVADENIPGVSGTELLAIVAGAFPACGVKVPPGVGLPFTWTEYGATVFAIPTPVG